MSEKIREKHDIPEARRRKSRKAIKEKAKLLNKDGEANQILVKDFREFVESKSEELGKDPNELVNELITSNFAVVEFSESTGKASLTIPSWSTPSSAVKEKQPTERELIEEYRKLADNFAPVAAGIEWHRDFTSGGGFVVQIDDPKDKHKQQMKREINEFNALVFQDDYTRGLDMILDILMYQGIIDGCAAAEIVYDLGVDDEGKSKEVKFEDFIQDFEEVNVPDPTKDGKTVTLKVIVPKEPKWGTDLKGIVRLKIIDDAVNRLYPYRHPLSGQILFWTLDEKVTDPNAVLTKYGTKQIANPNVIKFHPWEILWLPWNQHGTNLKGTSQVKAVYEVAKFVQKIQNAVGVGFNRWANKKYFFVCGTDKRPWGKPHSDQFLIAMEKMLKNNWVGIPVPAGFDVKEIGGEQSIFEGKSLLDYLTGMICAGMQYPREFLEVGRTQAGDKAWLAWTVRYGRSQLQIRRHIEHQLWQRQLWCLHDKTRRIKRKGVSPDNQEEVPTYVPKMEWRAEGQWHRDTKMKVLGGILNVANPADPPLKLAIEKEMAVTMGLGEIDFSLTEDLLEIGTKLSVANKKTELLTAEATLEIMQDQSDTGKLKGNIEAKMKVKQEAAVNPPSQPDGQQKLQTQLEKREEGGVSRTTKESGTKDKKGESKPVGGTRIPQFGETATQITMTMPDDLMNAMINTEKSKQETEKIRQESERVKKEQKDLIEALRKRLSKEDKKQ